MRRVGVSKNIMLPPVSVSFFETMSGAFCFFEMYVYIYFLIFFMILDMKK
jgi:hypothetical protein